MNNAITTTIGGEQSLSFLSPRNFADDQSVRLWVEQNLLPVIAEARSDRRTLEEEWREIRRMVLMEHDGNQKYIGRSNAYIPAYAKARDTLVSSMSRALFPSDDYLDVRLRTEKGMEESKVAKDYIQYEFEKQARVRSNIKEFIGQFVDYGLSVAKAWYEPGNSYRQLRAVRGPKTGDIAGDLLVERKTPLSTAGARFSTRNVFYWYVWPTTVTTVDEASLVFEDIDVTLQDAKRLDASGVWKNIREANEAFGTDSDHEFNLNQQQTEMMGVPSNPKQGGATSSELSRTLTAVECWLDMPVPDADYSDDEERGSPVPCKVTVIGGVIVEARRNPFWHQKKPYLVNRMRTAPGSFYPKGAGAMGRFLQYLVNDFSNQLNDNGTYALNPIAIVNPNVLAGPLPPIKPGVTIKTHDPANAVRFERPPVEQLQHGLMLVNTYLSALQDMVGAPPILQGLNAGKGARTATSAQILQRNASNPIQDVVEDMENDVLVPFMHMIWSFGNQYRTSPLVDELNGSVISVSPDDLMGDAVMKFLASSQAVNQQQRAQQAMTLLQILPPLMPLLQMQGKTVDPTPLLQRIYSDGFGFRNFETVIKDAPMQPPGMPGVGGPAAGAPGAPPGMGGGNAGDSAIPESNESVAGEGEDFANVRDEADGLAAMLGSLGGA